VTGDAHGLLPSKTMTTILLWNVDRKLLDGSVQILILQRRIDIALLVGIPLLDSNRMPKQQIISDNLPLPFSWDP
jgi:hypothetical protein